MDKTSPLVEGAVRHTYDHGNRAAALSLLLRVGLFARGHIFRVTNHVYEQNMSDVQLEMRSRFCGVNAPAAEYNTAKLWAQVEPKQTSMERA